MNTTEISRREYISRINIEIIEMPELKVSL